MEKQTQEKLIRYLKKRGCYVIKTKPGLGTPVGCPDILALCEGFWAAFEIKGSARAKFQPLQQETLVKLNDWSYARVVYPENLAEIICELETML